MKKMIMFVTYDFSDLSSGSKVRPKKMYEAFKEIGYDVYLISGNKIEKEQSFERLKKEETMNFDFCYVEPSSYPMQPLIDYKIIKHIKNKNIPIGIFYRDAYWKFYNNLVNSYKNVELKFRYQCDLLFFKKMSSIMFFPSDEMANHFSFKQPKVSLPPAADKTIIPNKKQENERKIPTAIYVGGLSKRYGTELLLQSFERVNKIELKSKLLLVCRKEDLEKNLNLFSYYKNKNWLEIKHVSGVLLEKEYDKADFGVIPLLKDSYNDFAVPVKLFEYLSFGLPILSTDCKVLESYIVNNKLGIVGNSTLQSFSEGIRTMIEDYVDFIGNVKSFVNEYGRWEHRAEKVESILLKKNPTYIIN